MFAVTIMSDPVGFILLLAIGAFCLALAIIGLRRGKAVTFFGHSRIEAPARFWYSVAFQLGIGIVCLVLAVTKIFK